MPSWTEKFYHDHMTEEQRGYFRGRGISDETSDTLLLGYAPKGNVLWGHFQGKYPASDLR